MRFTVAMVTGEVVVDGRLGLSRIDFAFRFRIHVRQASGNGLEDRLSGNINLLYS